MILGLALGCLTQAAQEQKPQPVAVPPPTYVDLGLPLRVPEELLEPRDVAAVCNAELVFIGTIVDAQSFMGRDRTFDPPLRWPDVILTEATFEVERVIAGSAGPKFTDIFGGGEVADGRSHWGHSLYPGVGRRYGLAMVRRSYQHKLESNYTGRDAPLMSACTLKGSDGPCAKAVPSGFSDSTYVFDDTNFSCEGLPGEEEFRVNMTSFTDYFEALPTTGSLTRLTEAKLTSASDGYDVGCDIIIFQGYRKGDESAGATPINGSDADPAPADGYRIMFTWTMAHSARALSDTDKLALQWLYPPT